MFLKDFQNKKDELSSISYLKKHEFLIRTFLIFLMGITYFPLSILQELSTFLSSSAWISSLQQHESVINNLFMLFLLFYFFIFLLLFISTKTSYYFNELIQSFHLLSTVGTYYIMLTQILHNIDLWSISVYEILKQIISDSRLTFVLYAPPLMLLLLTFTMSIIGYFYHSRDN